MGGRERAGWFFRCVVFMAHFFILSYLFYLLLIGKSFCNFVLFALFNFLVGVGKNKSFLVAMRISILFAACADIVCFQCGDLCYLQCGDVFFCIAS